MGMDIHIDPGQIAIASPNNSGSVLCTSDAIETLTLTPAPPAGTDRADLVVCRPRSVDLDGTSNQEDFIFEAIAGATGSPPGTQPLAWVTVRGGSASIAPADVSDIRYDFARFLGIPDAWPPPHPRVPLVAFRVEVTAGMSIPAGAWTKITGTWGAPNYNVGGGTWANAEFTIPHDGLYLVLHSVRWYLTGTVFGATNKDFMQCVFKNGTVQVNPQAAIWGASLQVGSGNVFGNGSWVWPLVKGDKLDLRANHNGPAAYSTNVNGTALHVIELPHVMS